jgi:hypothetical protein
LIAASRLDLVLLAHTTVLAFAYIPGRAAVTLTGTEHALTWGMRTHLSPILLTALLVAVLWTAWNRPMWRISRWTSDPPG